MRQAVEEAARENILFNHRTVDRTLSGKDLAKFGEMNFIQGAEWHAKQSPWISVEERLPEDTNEKLVMLVDGTIRIAHYDEDYNEDMEYHFWYDCAASESYHRDDVIYWMPIPSFDEILEANRDVLERIKEKGD